MSLRERFNLSRIAIKYARLTICFWLAITVAGWLAFSSLQYALFPDITFPVVVIDTQTSLDVLETEAQVTKPIEDVVYAIAGLDELYSSTYPGGAAITLTFYPGTSLETSTGKVKTVLEEISLPPQTTFTVNPFNLNESAAVTYAVTSDRFSLEELATIVEAKIAPTITDLPGVLKVNLFGDGLSTEAAATDSERSLNEPESLLSNFPTLVRFNGENALALEVIKRENANTLEVVSQVKQAVEQLQSSLGVEISIAKTQAEYIREATQATIDGIILAVILAVSVIFLFLRNFWATLITALAIPISLLGTCLVMALFGFNLETITLLAIALVVGIIVDDAIVDVENIARYIEAGESPRQAAIIATDEIGLTVSASTLTIVAVFLPVGLMGGTVGQFFRPFGITVSAAVLISLLVARTLSPVLAIYWLKPKRNPEAEVQPMARQGFWLTNPYRRLLHWSLKHRQVVISLAIFCFVVGVALIPLIPQGFIPRLNRGEFNIIYTTSLPQLDLAEPEATDTTEVAPEDSDGAFEPNSFDWLAKIAQSPTRLLLRQSRRVAQKLEAGVERSPLVETVYTQIGIQGEPNRGRLYVKLKPELSLSTAEAQAEIREALPQLPGVTTSVEDLQFIEVNGAQSFQIALVGEDLATLGSAAEAIKTRLEQVPGFLDVTVSASENQPEILKIERQNRQRVVYVSANLTQDLALGDATEKAIALATPILPPRVSIELGGDSARSSEVIESFAGTLGLSIILMLLVLLLLFGRLLEPIVVGLSLPLSIVGAMLGLLVTRSDFSIISLIGIVFLLGLLDKNALLLVDYANQLRRSGLDRSEALLETGAVRLRPILMTTTSTLLGMLPIALGLGAGAELRQPMAVTIIGGLITSSGLSLIVVPVLYTLLEDMNYSVLSDD